VEAFLQFDGNAPCDAPLVTKMKSTVCPFCGVVSESAHDSQEACIRALQYEIQHTRQILTEVDRSARPGRVAPGSDPDDDETAQPT
jgi:hypothetical protein